MLISYSFDHDDVLGVIIIIMIIMNDNTKVMMKIATNSSSCLFEDLLGAAKGELYDCVAI